MIDLNKEKLELEYPCQWIYKLVVLSDHKIKSTVDEIVVDKEYNLKDSNQSSKGKFVSYRLEITVENEEERVGIFDSFRNHKDIKMVI